MSSSQARLLSITARMNDVEFKSQTISNTKLRLADESEADYNAATARINRKEKLLDNELKALDTEHNALKTEQDAIKSLISDNVSKTFNIFS